MTDKILRKYLLLGATSVLTFASGAALAAEEGKDKKTDEWMPEEIVVTASRREETLQDVGMAISVVYPEQFDTIGLSLFEDIIAYTLGITVIYSIDRITNFS